MRYRERVFPGNELKGVGLGPLLMAAHLSGISSSRRQIKLKCSSGTGNGELAPVVHGEAYLGGSPSFRNDERFTDGRQHIS